MFSLFLFCNIILIKFWFFCLSVVNRGVCLFMFFKFILVLLVVIIFIMVFLNVDVVLGLLCFFKEFIFR